MLDWSGGEAFSLSFQLPVLLRVITLLCNKVRKRRRRHLMDVM